MLLRCFTRKFDGRTPLFAYDNLAAVQAAPPRLATPRVPGICYIIR
jgi:hypothetical protein